MKIVAGTFSASSELNRPRAIRWKFPRSRISPTTGPSSIVIATVRARIASCAAATEHNAKNANTEHTVFT